MVLFPSNGNGRHGSLARSAGEADGEAGISVIAADLLVEGQLRSSGTVKVAGKVTGTLRAERQVRVAEGGVVEGDIYASEVVVAGEVRGLVVADGRIELHATAMIHGDLKAPRLLVHEGGRVTGQVRMGQSTAGFEQDMWTKRAVSQPVAAGGR